MPEYHLAFAEKLADTAGELIDDGIDEIDAQRTVLYLSLLASEIALKAMLEKAGKPVSEIKKRSHNLIYLLQDIDDCEIEVDVTPNYRRPVPASRLRSQVVDKRFRKATVGALLKAEADGASIYPNQIRYGDVLKHYPAALVAKMATVICGWAREHWDTIRVS